MGRQGVANTGAATPAPSWDTYEQRALVLINQERARSGVPPLRLNRELTQAARSFGKDALTHSLGCTHQGSDGSWPWDRARRAGYYGSVGAENVLCGIATPEQAVAIWMDSPSHRAAILDPVSREVGIGYVEMNGGGYWVQDFGHDPQYLPVVMNNEAVSTTSPWVDLSIYDSETITGTVGLLGPVREMLVSNSSCFVGAQWQPYRPLMSWNLAWGTGYRTVYVKRRDASGRTLVSTDTIWVGTGAPDAVPWEFLASRSPTVTLTGLGLLGYSTMQFSLGWVVEGEDMRLWWGEGRIVNDPAASAERALWLAGGIGTAYAWSTPTDYPHNVPSQAYLRLKVGQQVSAEVARFTLVAGGVTYGPLSLRGTDFPQANTYQEFALDFTQPDHPLDPWLRVIVERTGPVDVTVDRVVFFTAPEPMASTKVWAVPGGNYRGQGVWVRYRTASGGVSPVIEAGAAIQDGLSIAPAALSFTGTPGQALPAKTVNLTQGACSSPWLAQASEGWVQVEPSSGMTPALLSVGVRTQGMGPGLYRGHVTIMQEQGGATEIPVSLFIARDVRRLYLPVIRGREP